MNGRRRGTRRNPASKHQIQLSMEMSRLTRDGTAEPVSRDQILRHVRGQGNIHFPCSADHAYIAGWSILLLLYIRDHTYKYAARENELECLTSS